MHILAGNRSLRQSHHHDVSSISDGDGGKKGKEQIISHNPQWNSSILLLWQPYLPPQPFQVHLGLLRLRQGFRPWTWVIDDVMIVWICRREDRGWSEQRHSALDSLLHPIGSWHFRIRYPVSMMIDLSSGDLRWVSLHHLRLVWHVYNVLV